MKEMGWIDYLRSLINQWEKISPAQREAGNQALDGLTKSITNPLGGQTEKRS